MFQGQGYNLIDVRVSVVISKMLTCDSSVVVLYDRKKSRLCNAPLDVKYDNYRTERKEINPYL